MPNPTSDPPPLDDVQRYRLELLVTDSRKILLTAEKQAIRAALAEIDRLRAKRDALLEACKALLSLCEGAFPNGTFGEWAVDTELDLARTAIARTEAHTP